MKLMKLKTGIVLLGISLLTFNSTGCEQEDLDFYIDCDFCLEEIPEYDTLWITVTINDENPFVPLVLYLGDIEEGVVDFRDTTYTETRGIPASKVGQDYSIKATYMVDGAPVVAIDGDKMRIVDGEGECSPPCYYIRGGTLDVSLK